MPWETLCSTPSTLSLRREGCKHVASPFQKGVSVHTTMLICQSIKNTHTIMLHTRTAQRNCTFQPSSRPFALSACKQHIWFSEAHSGEEELLTDPAKHPGWDTHSQALSNYSHGSWLMSAFKIECVSKEDRQRPQSPRMAEKR